MEDVCAKQYHYDRRQARACLPHARPTKRPEELCRRRSHFFADKELFTRYVSPQNLGEGIHDPITDPSLIHGGQSKSSVPLTTTLQLLGKQSWRHGEQTKSVWKDSLTVSCETFPDCLVEHVHRLGSHGLTNVHKSRVHCSPLAALLSR